MSDPTRIVKDSFEQPLRENGFTEKGSCWYSETSEAILVAHLQRSRFGRLFYVNLAVWLKALGEAATPRENRCHLRRRLSRAKAERALDLDDEAFDDAGRAAVIAAAMKRQALPWLSACGSLAGVRKLLLRGKLNDSFIHADVYALAGG